MTDLPRSSLPIPARQHVGTTTHDAHDPDDHDHLITPDERYRVAVARQ